MKNSLLNKNKLVTGTKKANKKTALEEWRTHNPFQRASPELIRRVERELKELKLKNQEPAPF